MQSQSTFDIEQHAVVAVDVAYSLDFLPSLLLCVSVI